MALMAVYIFPMQFREQIRDLIEKNGAALGAQKTLEAELAEVSSLPHVRPS